MARLATNRRRDVVMRPIEPTTAQRQALGSLYMGVVRVWHEGARDRILPAYRDTLEQKAMTRDAVGDVEVAIATTEARAVSAIFDFSFLFQGWANSVQAWHMNKFISQMKYATNVDLSTMMGPGDTRLTIAELLARNVALVRDVSDQVRGRIADIVFRGLQANTPVREVAKQIAEVTGLARARALRIASDQTVKLSAALDQERQLQVGMDSFEWMHSGKEHYRPHHLARDKKEFRWDSEIAKTDAPGMAPFCGCKARGVLHLEPPRASERIPLPRAMVRPPRALVRVG
jgi:SPP1 gp7 family putative phage head morphogenesis protein